LRLTKTSLTLINRTRLRTKGQSAGYPQAQIGITSNSFQRRAPVWGVVKFWEFEGNSGVVKSWEFAGKILQNELCPFHEIIGFTLTLLEKVPRSKNSEENSEKSRLFTGSNLVLRPAWLKLKILRSIWSFHIERPKLYGRTVVEKLLKF